MPDDVKAKNDQPESNSPRYFPVAAIFWVLLSIPIFLLSTVEITLQDRELFDPHMDLELVEESETQFVYQLVDGLFRYDEDPLLPTNVETGTYTAAAFADGESVSPVAEAAFENVPDVESISIAPQRIEITYAAGAEYSAVEREVNRSVRRFLNNRAADIEITQGDNNTLVMTTTDPSFAYDLFVPALVTGEPEVYENREAAENGSLLAQTVMQNSQAIQGMTIEAGHITVTVEAGTRPLPVERRLEDALFSYFPRADLNLEFWALTAASASDTIISIVPINTGVPLWVYTLAFALVEAAMAWFFRGSNDKLVRPLVRVAGIFLFFWSIFGHEPLWDWILGGLFPDATQLVHPSSRVVEFAAQHLELVIISSLITIPLGLFLGILVTRENFRELLPLVNNLVNSGQTVPTIAIVAVMAPILGFGFWPAIIALIAYGLLPVLRNTIAGIEGVADSVIDSGRGMGMTPSQILFRIELPIASTIIMAGIRTSMVINVGTATLGAFVGSGGLGTPIASGLSMTVDAFIVLGALPAAMLAILIDYILGRIEYVLTPRGLQIER